MPLAPRWRPVAAWTGDEVLVVGGGVTTPCPPNALCTDADVMARDGAAYDPVTDTWRRIADAPVDVGYWFRSVAVGDLVVLLAEDRFWAYDLAQDAWRALPEPPRRFVDTGVLTARDGQVYVGARSGHVLALDVAAATWSELPLSPHAPAIRHGTVIATEDGVLVSGSPDIPDWDGDTPIFTLVDRWDGTSWSRLPETGQVRGFWSWTGTRLIAPTSLTATGMDGNPPEGGVLDVGSGRWSPVPNLPTEGAAPERGWYPNAVAGPLVATGGYAYDDRTERWTALGRPGGTSVDDSQSAVWADGTLIVVGGVDTETGYEDLSGLSDGAWAWTP
jgi:hypothetical protein